VWGGDEDELVRRCREGSDAAYAALVRLHRPRLYALAVRLTSDRATAEDVVQETFLAAFKGLDRFEPKPSLSAWLNTICVRIAGRTATRPGNAPKASLDRTVGAVGTGGSGQGAPGATLGENLIAADPAGDPASAVETAELRRELTDAIARLPFKYRAPVVLRHVLGLDYADAAIAMDVPLNTFKSQLLRGTRMLRNDLSDRLEIEQRAPAHAREVEAGPVELTSGRVAGEGVIR
jgi:RNA polymerase sigma-70 factor (ECF subfamily)